MKNKIMKTLLSVAVLTAMTNSLWAAGTEANTDIDNKATISYSVGGTAQTAINSSPTGNSDPTACTATGDCQTTFKVDKKVDLLVTAGSGLTVVPGTSGASTEIEFTVKNEGNSDEDFTLSTTGIVTGDDFDTTSCSVTDPASPVAIAQDATQAVKVQCTIPANNGTTVSNGKTSLVDLLAAADVAAETTEVESADTVDIVYADDAGTSTDTPNGSVSGDKTRNAKHSATNTYTIGTAALVVAKTSEVLNDPYNSTNNPKRIPGAEIEYTITITNSGNSAATDLTISDDIPANMTYKAGSCSVNGGGTCATTGTPITNISATGVTIVAPVAPATTTATMTFIAIVN